MKNELNLSPLMRSFIGFDELQSRLTNAMQQASSMKFPPYDIESLSDDEYVINMAVAGYTKDELDIELHDRKLTVTGSKPENEAETRKFIHKGISARSFKQVFQLGEFIEVKNVDLQNGMLSIALTKQVPEDKKPMKLNIT